MTRKDHVTNVINACRIKALEYAVVDGEEAVTQEWDDRADAVESLLRDYESRGWALDMEAK